MLLTKSFQRENGVQLSAYHQFIDTKNTVIAILNETKIEFFRLSNEFIAHYLALKIIHIHSMIHYYIYFFSLFWFWKVPSENPWSSFPLLSTRSLNVD